MLQVDKEFRDYADYVILASGRSQRHIRSQGERIVKEVGVCERVALWLRGCSSECAHALFFLRARTHTLSLSLSQ